MKKLLSFIVICIVIATAVFASVVDNNEDGRKNVGGSVKKVVVSAKETKTEKDKKDKEPDSKKDKKDKETDSEKDKKDKETDSEKDEKDKETDSEKDKKDKETDSKKDKKDKETDSKKDKRDEESKQGSGKTENNDLAEKVSSKGKDTLMIYMVGSDLEARSGAGTDDLKEIEESGIDLKNANVLVYAGGAQRWHNDTVCQGNNTILQLNKNGFEVVAECEVANMGDSSSLIEFLNYSYKNYPSDSYSLVMWNHGNGPVIGYGKDMLFDNDSLTLAEMRDALEASPFGGRTKLQWVGFDACLMSSAELVCIWDDYADYLVASQEVEPSFGWDYSFLKNFGKKEPSVLSQDIVDGYMSTCLEYYDERGYDDRDTTLACMNLAYGSELEQAVNGLFARADMDVNTNYNALVSKRVNTRALGRASTGSEYDLIDLNDMAAQLSELYPEESRRISEAVKKLVIKNGTNTTGCCGISLYYPFYNKYFYEDSWAAAYGNLNLFENYRSYLNKYQEIWLTDDKLEQYASSNTPKVTSDTENKGGFEDDMQRKRTYELELTPEQNENFAEAKVYILAKAGEEMFHVMFSDDSVTNNNGVLSYNFEGKGIFVKNKFGEYYLPVSTGYDSVGDISRYSLKIGGKKVGDDDNAGLASFNLSLNKKTGDVKLSSVTPYVDAEPTRSVSGGKQEEIDISTWDYISPARTKYRILQRYDNNVIKPLEQWVTDGIYSWEDFCMRDNIEFVYSALDDGQYALIYEITDTQNNKYCSEPIDVEVTSDNKEVYKPEDINVEWISGERVKIFESDGAVLYMKKIVQDGMPQYVLEAENNNDFTVKYSFENVIINGDIAEGLAYLDALPNQTSAAEWGVRFQELTDAGVIDSVYSISGKLRAEIIGSNSIEKIQTIERNQTININISGDVLETGLKERYPKIDYNEPFFGAHSGEKQVFDNGKIRITVLGFGKVKDSYQSGGYICIENLTEKEQWGAVDYYLINGCSFEASSSMRLPPGCKKYIKFYLSSEKLKEQNVSAIETFKLEFSTFDYATINRRENVESVMVDLDYMCSSSGAGIAASDEVKDVLFDENNIKISVKEYGVSGYRGKPIWKMLIENNSDENISLRFGNDESLYIPDITWLGDSIAAHTRKTGVANYNNPADSPGEYEAKLYITDDLQGKIMYTKDVVLKVKPAVVPDGVINIDWNKGDETVVDNRAGIEFSIGKLDWYGNICYSLDVKNNRSEEAGFEISDIIVNGDILIDDDLAKSVAPGEKVSCAKIPYDADAVHLGVIDQISSISFKIKETGSFVPVDALNNHEFVINISDEAVIENLCEGHKIYDFSKPFMEARAGRQELMNNGELKIELIGFGSVDIESSWGEVFEYGYLGLCVENISSQYQKIMVGRVSVNDVLAESYGFGSEVLPPGCRAYFLGPIDSYGQLPFGITSIEKMNVSVELYDGDVKTEQLWLPVKLDEYGVATDIPEPEDVFFDKGGVKIASYSYGVDEYGTTLWDFELVNTTDEDLTVQIKDKDGGSINYMLSDISIGPQQRMLIDVKFYNKIIEELEFDVFVKDYSGTELIARSDELIKINGKELKNKGE